MRTKVVIDRFSDMVARQYGCGVKFHNLLDPADQPDKPTLELVRRNKLAKVIIQKDDILIPIEKDECLYGLIRIKDALVLGPDTIDKLYDLSEMLVKSVVISELKKQIMERLENYLLAQLSEDEIAYGELKTKNKEFASQLQMSQRLAEQKVPVLILAKTGAASEELAREIHKNSSCLDFQVFSQIDNIEMKSVDDVIALGNITLYIPELSVLSLDQQTAIESFFKLESKPKRSPRIIAATIQDPKILISAGLVRQTLIFELSRARITMPPLEDRREDVLGLIHFFSKTHSEGKRDLSSYGLETLSKLTEYRWPGNEKELEKEVIHAMRSESEKIQISDLSPSLLGERDFLLVTIAKTKKKLAAAVKSLEKEIILTTLKRNEGNKSEVSRQLGLSRSALHTKISELGIRLNII